MSNSKHNPFYPNSTQYPNILFDEVMAFLTSDEWKVLSYIVRRTYGFLKKVDIISIGQMLNGFYKKDGTRADYGTGLSENRFYKALKGLIEANIVYRIKTGRYNKYGLNLIRGSNFEGAQINWDYLQNRRKLWLEERRKNIASARIAKAKKKKPLGDIPSFHPRPTKRQDLEVG